MLPVKIVYFLPVAFLFALISAIHKVNIYTVAIVIISAVSHKMLGYTV